MLAIFKNKGENNPPEWLSEMEENRERWFTFLTKLESRMDELGKIAIPELIQAYQEKTDPYHQTWNNMSSGIRGQFKSMRDKVRAIKEEKISGFFSLHIGYARLSSKYEDMLYHFRNICIERENLFEEKHQLWQAKIDATEEEDLELTYQQIIAEYELIKHKFTCKQCGAALVIDKIYFISTYISCPQCQTQNTFQPSIQMQQLEQLGRNLAEKRTVHLLEAYHQEIKKERDLYHQRHTLELSLNADRQQIIDLESQRQYIIKSSPALYEAYLRAMFNEWNKIVPDLSEQNERFYESQLRQFRKYNN